MGDIGMQRGHFEVLAAGPTSASRMQLGDPDLDSVSDVEPQVTSAPPSAPAIGTAFDPQQIPTPRSARTR